MSGPHSTSIMNGVIKAFTPWSDSPSQESARYLVGSQGLAKARDVVDSLKKEDLSEYGLREPEKIKALDFRPEFCHSVDNGLGIVQLGPYDRKKVNVAALFRRFDGFFPNQRLPENLTAKAFICSSMEGLHPRSAIAVFAALRMAGASVSADKFDDPLHFKKVGRWFVKPSVKFRATFRRGDVALTCVMDARYWREHLVMDGQTLHGPGRLKMEDSLMRMNVTLTEYHDSIEGREILNSGLQEILDPLVVGGAPVFIRSFGEGAGPVQLVIGHRERVSREIREEMSKELGVHETGIIRGYEDPTREDMTIERE